ncbi:NAD(P)/FAD-dependent oxidoreductase [Nocardioides ultimimeridianus]
MSEFRKGVDRLVVIGGSLGGAKAAEQARQLGFQGSVTVISAEEHAPYDRPPLSKDFLVAEEDLGLVEHIDDPEGQGIDLRLGVTAVGLDPRSRIVRTSAGEVEYDAAIIATGAHPRSLGLGEDLSGITALRTASDVARIRERLQPGARVVVIGAGFIGGEVASSAIARGAEVTLVEAAPLPLERAVGSLVAERLAVLHRQYGADLRTRARVRDITGEHHVESVVLTDGTVLPADLVVVGIGVDPAVGWLRGSGVLVSDGVACSRYLESTVPGVYAAGDVARWVNGWSGRSTRLEHWTSTIEQAELACRNALLVERETCSIVPYFWSEWYGHRFQMLGEAADEVELGAGGGATDPFLARYRFEGHFVGGFSLDSGGQLMRQRRAITARGAWEDVLTTPAVAGRG